MTRPPTGPALAALALALAALALALVPATHAEVAVPGIFSHNMVIQRDKPFPVWGTAEPGEEVTVSFRNKQQTTVAGAGGHWRVTLPKPTVTATPRTLRIRGTNTLDFKNILVGEVWLCAGQSNMLWPVKHTDGAGAAIADSKRWPQIRIYRAPQVSSAEPSPHSDAYWQVASPKTVPTTSAVAYHFARKIHTTLYVPVGIIQCAWAGTRAEAWMPREAIASDPSLQPLLDAWGDAAGRWDDAFAKGAYDRQLNIAEQLRLQAQARGGDPPKRRPSPPSPPGRGRHAPGAIFNGTLHPLAPYPLRGFVWYQGESNVERADQYTSLLPLLIESWRGAWAAPDLPFVIAQLPNFGQPTTAPGQDSPWAELQNAQRLALKIPGAYLAVTNDLGDADTIHPRGKKLLAERLAAWPINAVYKKSSTTPSGPLFTNAEVLPGKLRLHFTHASGLKASNGKPLARFEIAGADKRWHWAEASIDGDTVLLESPDVPSPVAARYAWASNPTGANLTNATGLPASPFRSDAWPLWTTGRHAPKIDYLPPPSE